MPNITNTSVPIPILREGDREKIDTILKKHNLHVEEARQSLTLIFDTNETARRAKVLLAEFLPRRI